MKQIAILAAVPALGAVTWAVAAPEAGRSWKIHDGSRPRPPVVTPAAQRLPAPAPPDAVVLFDGNGLAEWAGGQGAPGWKVVDGVLTVVPGAGSLRTRPAFGDAQVHLEWAAPVPAE